MQYFLYKVTKYKLIRFYYLKNRLKTGYSMEKCVFNCCNLVPTLANSRNSYLLSEYDLQ